MTDLIHFVFLLAAAIHNAGQSHKAAGSVPSHATQDDGGVSVARLSSSDFPGDPWLCGPASRQVCLFVQPILRP